MPPKVKPERRRLEIVAEPEWISAVAAAAAKADRTISSYIRVAVNAQMEKDGVKILAKPVRPPGRPKKT
jgi:hypothetical protein